jgi:glucose-1-phosphate thymidylyltransferase
MKIIIPMAGRGSRLRPHTLTVPKPLVPIAGKPMVQRLVEDLAASYGGQIEEIAFIIGDFGEQVKKDLIGIAEALGAKGSVYSQDQPLGTAHAILCAQDSMSGPAFVAFADTLFKADFSVADDVDGMIWVQKVEDPSAFGVVKVDEHNIITDFVEKSPVFVSDLAIVGIYYFKDSGVLKNELQYLIDNNIKDKGEFQLTNGLENMKGKGMKFKPGTVEEWLDCGNKESVIYTNSRMLELKKDTEHLVDDSVVLENAVVIPPCYIGKNTLVKNSVIGPHVSIGNNSSIENSVISNSVIQNNTVVKDANLQSSMLGNLVEYQGKKSEISLGDHSVSQ